MKGGKTKIRVGILDEEDHKNTSLHWTAFRANPFIIRIIIFPTAAIPLSDIKIRVWSLWCWEKTINIIKYS